MQIHLGAEEDYDDEMDNNIKWFGATFILGQ